MAIDEAINNSNLCLCTLMANHKTRPVLCIFYSNNYNMIDLHKVVSNKYCINSCVSGWHANISF